MGIQAPSTPRAPRVIDTWVIPNPPGVAAQWPPQLAHVLHVFGRSAMLAGQTPQQVIDEMDAAGIGRAILTGLVEDGFEVPNDVVADWMAQFPDRFAGRASVDPRRPAEAVKELERCVLELGFGSLLLLPYAFGLPFSHRLHYPLFVKCVELGIPVVTQVGHTASLLPSEPGRPLYLDDVALDFPDLIIVGGHIGWPWTDEMLAMAWKHPNVYIDASAHLPSRYPAAFVDFMRGAGADKTMFGTDYPLLALDRAVAGVLRLGLPAEAQDKFLYANAARVFSLEASSAGVPSVGIRA
ncbi:MAG TPA: amidohydrolase family protein [Solirubrobacteraceae bacterium]|nr:amidohydrolase family protein [Solirubrobacteraceae bacterium]